MSALLNLRSCLFFSKMVEGSFSTVWTPMFASKVYFTSKNRCLFSRKRAKYLPSWQNLAKLTRFANVRDDTSSEDSLYIRTHHREPVRVHLTIHANGKLPANRPKGARPRSMTRDSALKNSRKILLAFAADECT